MSTVYNKAYNILKLIHLIRVTWHNVEWAC